MNSATEPIAKAEETPAEETLDGARRAGRVPARCARVGLSNETPWGAMKLPRPWPSRAGRGPRMASIQNPYSLLNRSFETGLAEVALARRLRTARLCPGGGRRISPASTSTVKRPAGARIDPVAQRTSAISANRASGCDRRPMSRWHGSTGPRPRPKWPSLSCSAQRFLTSAIVGATNLAQLENSIAAKAIWSCLEEVLNGYRSPFTRFIPIPAPEITRLGGGSHLEGTTVPCASFVAI